MHCQSAWGQWAVQLVQCTTSLPGGSGQWNFCNTLPHCLWAVGSGTSAIHCLIPLGLWGVQLLQYTTSLPGGQWAVQLLQCIKPPPSKAGACFYFIAYFYSLLAFISTIYAFAML